MLHIYNWTDYTSPEMVKKFEKDTGIKVTIDTYDSNETALAKLSSGAAGYDVIIISNDFVPIFVKPAPVPGCRRRLDAELQESRSALAEAGLGSRGRDTPCRGSGARPPIPSIPTSTRARPTA